VFDVLNASFVDLYGFVALTDREIEYYTKQYFSFIKPEYVCFIADPSDKIIGFGISMPSLSKALQKAKGRLFPFGFIHILRALRKNDTIDLYLNGVLPEWQNRGVHSLYYSEMNKAYIRNNIRIAVSNPQLESNTHAISAWKSYEKELYIRRRCYRKML
jgi:ribosomal protein S18 acetylase RimI-like enzyme